MSDKLKDLRLNDDTPLDFNKVVEDAAIIEKYLIEGIDS